MMCGNESLPSEWKRSWRHLWRRKWFQWYNRNLNVGAFWWLIMPSQLRSIFLRILTHFFNTEIITKTNSVSYKNFNALKLGISSLFLRNWRFICFAIDEQSFRTNIRTFSRKSPTWKGLRISMEPFYNRSFFLLSSSCAITRQSKKCTNPYISQIAHIKIFNDC